MKPVNSNSLPNVYESGLITWTGPAIPCLGICAGQKINSVVKTIAEKVCELTSPLDLTHLTLQCALDIFDRDETGSRTIASVLQLLIDNECGLKELIDGLQLKLDGISEDNLVLDLKCLAVKDSLGNALPYNQQTVLQSLVNGICSLTTTVGDVAGALTTLTGVVNDHINKPEIIKENSISTCITPGATPVSQSLILLSRNYCDFKDIIGSVNAIQTALGRQTAEINQKMSAVSGWNPAPINLAQSISNLWLYEKFNDDRLTNIENNCCKISCKDIKIGFDIIVTDSTLSLAFTSLAGTEIPAGLTDQGSYLILIDNRGVSINYSIVVEANKTKGEYPFSGLSTEGPISVKLFSILGSDSLHCQQVTEKTFTVAATEQCCVLTNNSSSDNTIVYKTTPSSLS